MTLNIKKMGRKKYVFGEVGAMTQENNDFIKGQKIEE